MSPRGARIVGRSSISGLPEPDERLGGGLRALKGLAPYMWPRDSLELRARVVIALVLLVAGKLVNITIPLFYKHAVDALSVNTGAAPNPGLVAVPVAFILSYGARTRSVAGLQRAAQRGLREGRAARRAPDRAVDIQAYPCTVAALSPRTAHRRSGARRRARHGGDRVPAVLHAVQRRPDPVRDRRSSVRSCGGCTIGPSPSSRWRRSSSISLSLSSSPTGASAIGAR